MPLLAKVTPDAEKDGVIANDSDVVELGPAERARLLRKLDRHLLPVILLLCFPLFLDRSNVGNGKIADMSTDLNLVGLRYNIATAVFFVPYSLAEVPSNIMLKLFRPSRWFPIIVLAWGMIMTSMSMMNTYQELLVGRVFLGLAVAGLFPGVNYYISMWYPRADRARRIAIFFSAVTVSGAFGGLLAYAIEKMNGICGLHGWQWIFLLEGLAMIPVTYGLIYLMHDYPETASFLAGLATHFDFKFVLQAFKDYNSYIQTGISTGLLIPGYATTLFSPTIINELGFSATNAQLLSIPPFVVGCICTLFVGFYSDLHNIRGPFVIIGAFIALVGYIVLDTQTSSGASYAGTVLAAAGTFAPTPVILAWASSNAGGDTKRGAVISMVIGIGNLGGIFSSFVYLDPPRFHIGHRTMIGFLSLSIILSAFAMWNYSRINKQKEEFCHKHEITEARSNEFQDMGDESPLFRYTI